MGAQPVELVEDEEGPAPAGPRRRFPVRALVVVAVVLAGVLVAGQAVLDARQRAHEAELQKVPGILDMLDEPALLWSAGWSERVTGGVRAGGVLVWAEVDDAGTVTVTGATRRTGEVAWTTRVELPDDQRAALERGENEAGVPCLALAAPDEPPAVACLASARWGETSSDRPARLVVVDEAGTVVSERTVQADLWGVRRTHVVLATVEGEDPQTWTVSEQTASGAEVWSRTLDPVPAPDQQLVGTVPSPRIFGGADCTVLVTGRAAATLDGAGELVGVVVADAEDYVDAVPPCSVVLHSFDTSSSQQLVLPGHEPLPTGVGPAFLLLDDASVPGLVMTSEPASKLGARDVATGEVAWETTLSPEGGLRLDGRVYATQDRQVVAVDGRTGRELWRTEAPFSARSLATDGRHVVVVGDDSVVALLDLAGGRLQRTVDLRDLLPEGAVAESADVYVYAWEGLLVLITPPAPDDEDQAGRVWVIG